MSIYLNEAWLENCGPLEQVHLKPLFSPQGLPLPIVIVGQNGSGKSVLLSYIVDALAEFEKTAFQDVVPHEGMRTPFFRIVMPSGVRSGRNFSICLLNFKEQDKILNYCEKVGAVDKVNYRPDLKPIFSSVWNWPSDKGHKVVSADKQTVEDAFRAGAYAFFPASRREIPDWLNPISLQLQIEPSTARPNDSLGKPFWVETSATENLRWILDVFLDSQIDLQTLVKAQQHAMLAQQQGLVPTANRDAVDINNRQLLRQARQNVESILREILQDANAELVLNLRQVAASRLSVQMSDGRVIPSLHSLSAGQAILFHLFTTIIRYADKGNINMSIRLSDIAGIIIVDEIDAHLHTVLQYEVLPKLIKLFPKVQFIVSSHAPLFVLGMEKLFGQYNFSLIDMPSGKTISSERFEEFRRSMESYQDTKQFEEIIEQRLLKAAKPLILTEGPLDPKYITTALKLLGEEELLQAVEIKFVGLEDAKGTRHGGDTGLNHFRNVCEANPRLLNQPTLLLYDCDTNKPPEHFGRLWVRSITRNPNNAKVKKGIENLLPSSLFESRFYQQKTKEGDYGEATIISEFDKTGFCKWVCDDRMDSNDFANFSVVTDLLKQFKAAFSPVAIQP